MGWVGRGIVACVAMVVGLTAWAAIARALAPKENTTQEHFDVLMVLGSPADADGNPTPTELERVTEAVRRVRAGRGAADDHYRRAGAQPVCGGAR